MSKLFLILAAPSVDLHFIIYIFLMKAGASLMTVPHVMRNIIFLALNTEGMSSAWKVNYVLNFYSIYWKLKYHNNPQQVLFFLEYFSAILTL